MPTKVIATSGKYADYVNESQASHKLGYSAYRIAPEGSPTLVFMCENSFFCLGAHKEHLHNLSPKAITKTHYLAYWQESSSEGNATSIKGDRGIRSKRGATGEAGPIGSHVRKEFEAILVRLEELESREIEVVLDRLDRNEKLMKQEYKGKR